MYKKSIIDALAKQATSLCVLTQEHLHVIINCLYVLFHISSISKVPLYFSLKALTRNICLFTMRILIQTPLVTNKSVSVIVNKPVTHCARVPHRKIVEANTKGHFFVVVQEAYVDIARW